MVFDGNGNYTFTGQRMSSALGQAVNLTAQGTYAVAANGLIAVASLVDPRQMAYGESPLLGPSAFASERHRGNPSVDTLIGIPAGTNVNNASAEWELLGLAISSFPTPT